ECHTTSFPLPKGLNLGLIPVLDLVLVWFPSGGMLLGGGEDQRDLFVSGAEQRKHPLCELGVCVEAVNLCARLHVVEGDLTHLHIQEDAHLSQLRMVTFHLQGGDGEQQVSV
ncbi:hypothetical protein XENOCAPTIV_008189, partial [Xenoophorus captivus]